MSQDETDFYALLGVSRGATDDEIKKAYRKLARELHPDVNPGDAEAERRFKQMTLAYEVLRDPERRQRYDQFGIDGVRGSTSGGGAGDPFSNFGNMGDMNLGDIFDAFFGGGGGGGGFGGRRAQSGAPAGPDMETTAVISLEQAVFGAEVNVSLRLPVICDVCSGSGAAPGTQPITCRDCKGAGEVRRVRQSILGQMVTASPCQRCMSTGREVEKPCPTCRGEGRRSGEQSHQVQIPAGIDRGQTLRVSGKGGAGPRGGPLGDLYVHVDVTPDERFIRQNFDLNHQMHVSVAQAALGADLTLDTFDGQEEVHVEPGTQTGKQHRFRGKGVQQINARSRGDLIVHILVDTPVKLDEEQAALLRQFAELRGEQLAEPQPGLFGKIKDAFK